MQRDGLCAGQHGCALQGTRSHSTSAQGALCHFCASGRNVVPLRAAEVPTEIRLDEDQAAAPAYVDLTNGEAQRRPLIPDQWRTPENARRHVTLAAARHGHRAAYHGLRSPAYFIRAVGFAVWGVVIVLRQVIAWWIIPGTTRLEWEAAANGLLNDHLRIHKQGRETLKARGTILALCMAGLAAAVVAMVAFAPWWGWAVAAVVLFVAFALAGRPQGTTITTKAERPRRCSRQART
jgi:S-DNA-T family DNA segregation ATPase FtsK/SpoIIIE